MAADSGEPQGRSYLGLIALILVVAGVVGALVYTGAGTGGGHEEKGHAENGHETKGDDGHGASGPGGHGAEASKEATGLPVPLVPGEAAGAALPLGSDAVLTRIAFGSCLNQEKPMPILASVMARMPELFIWAGDNVYADKRDEATGEMLNSPELIAAAYATLGSTPEFQAMRSKMPFLATWDDHDYGLNDAGAELPYKARSEELFTAFWGPAGGPNQAGYEGIYDAVTYGPEGRRVQIILLDTRSFRSELKPTDERNAEGKERYLPDSDPAKTMLGDAQWAWLKERLAEPADLRLLVSSIQVVAEGHGWERWGNLPAERQKLYDLIKETSAKGVIILSGDRHAAMIYKADIGAGYPVYEITSSSLNASLRSFGIAQARAEPDPQRLDAIYIDENFGVVEIDWAAKAAFLELRALDGALIQGVSVPFGG